MNLDKDDVVNVSASDTFVDASTFTVEEAIACIADWMDRTHAPYEEWSKEGIKCRVMQSGKGWLKGKVRLSLEFIPDDK